LYSALSFKKKTLSGTSVLSTKKMLRENLFSWKKFKKKGFLEKKKNFFKLFFLKKSVWKRNYLCAGVKK